MRGLVLVAAAATLWALIGVCARELEDLGLDGGEVGAWRALIGGACFVVHYLVIRRRNHKRDETELISPRADSGRALAQRGVQVSLIAFCAIGIVVFYAALPIAAQTGGISLAWVLLYTAPAWVTLGAALFLGEHPDRVQWTAVAAAVLGVAALVATAGGTVVVSVESVTWGLIAGIGYSSHYLLGRRLFERLGAVETYAIVLPAGGVALALITGLTAPDSTAMVLWLVFLGVCCTYVPYLLFALGLPSITSSRAVVVATIEPLVATAIGVAFYGESLGPVGAVGALVVLGAAVVSGTRR